MHDKVRNAFASACDDLGLSHVSLSSGAGHDAVSYTHLRAHETVLDLVCRLLLEKKHPRDTKSILNDNT